MLKGKTMIASAVRDLGSPCENASQAAYQAVTQHLQSQSKKWRDIADRLPAHLRSNRFTATIGMMDSDIIFQALAAMRQATKMIAAKGSSWSEVLGSKPNTQTSQKTSANPNRQPKPSKERTHRPWQPPSYSYEPRQKSCDDFLRTMYRNADGSWSHRPSSPAPRYKHTKENIEENLRKASDEYDSKNYGKDSQAVRKNHA